LQVSDANTDVVQQESIVNGPEAYSAPESEPEAQEEPVSLDNPTADPETEEADADEAEGDSDDGDAETSGDGEESEAEEEPEKLEFDFGGNKLEVPKDAVAPEVAEALSKFSKDIWVDYTKKSQANAEAAKQLKARAEAMGKIESLGGEALDAFTKGKSIKAEIEQLLAVDMQSLWQSNPDQARQLSDRLSAKQAELNSIIRAVDQYESQLSEARQAELARQSEEGRQILDRKYKGFSTEIAPKLEAYAVTQGIPEDDAKMWAANPVVAEMAYKAMIYDQMQAAKKPKPTPGAKAKPVRAMKNAGKSTGAANPNSMGFSELGKVLGLK
jgi:hypothetical protein